MTCAHVAGLSVLEVSFSSPPFVVRRHESPSAWTWWLVIFPSFVNSRLDLVFDIRNLLLFFCILLLALEVVQICASVKTSFVSITQLISRVIADHGQVVSAIPAHLLLKLLLQVFDMVDVEVPVESQAIDEVFMADSPHHGKYLDVVATIFYFKVVSDERVILKAGSDQLLVGADVKAKGLTIVIFAFEGNGHLDCLQIEKPYVAIVARRNQEENSLLAACPPRSRG